MRKSKFLCEFCNKDFAQKIHLHHHAKVCDANAVYVTGLKQKIYDLTNTVETYEERMKTLEQEKNDMVTKLLKHSEVIAKQPRYTQNNKINITQNLAVFNKTDEDIQKLVEDGFNREHLIKGQKGAAKFANDQIINMGPDGKPVYVITDKTRGHGRYRVSPNETVIDNGMIGLSEKVMPSVRRKAAMIYSNDFDNQEVEDGYNDLVLEDMSDFRSEMIKLQTQDVERLTVVEDSVPALEEIKSVV